MDQKSQERQQLFQQVALIQLQTRAAGVLKGSVDGVVVCPKFMEDVAIITEQILNESQRFGAKLSKSAEEVQQLVEAHQQHIASLMEK